MYPSMQVYFKIDEFETSDYGAHIIALGDIVRGGLIECFHAQLEVFIFSNQG